MLISINKSWQIGIQIYFNHVRSKRNKNSFWPAQFSTLMNVLEMLIHCAYLAARGAQGVVD